jgi:hypothetical protein
VVAAAAAGGLLLTVTGTIGGLCFVVWRGLDHVISAARAGQDTTGAASRIFSGLDAWC